MNQLAKFMAKCAADIYPEPRTEGHDQITAQVAPLVAKFLPAMASVLDVGCGQGPALAWFTEHGFKPMGIGIGMEDNLACKNAGFIALHCDQNEMPENWSGRFDCVWARHVLEHSIAPFFTLSEFYRVLKPGGILYCELPSPETDCCHEYNANHYSVLGGRAWTSLIVRSGFEILESRNIQLQTPAGRDLYLSFICRKL